MPRLLTPRCYALFLAVLMMIPCALEARRGREASKEPATLTLWMNQAPAMNAAYQNLVEAYQKIHPEVKIALQTFEYDAYIQRAGQRSSGTDLSDEAREREAGAGAGVDLSAVERV